MSDIITVPFVFDKDTYLKWIRFEKYDDLSSEIESMLNEILPIVKPRIMLKETSVDSVSRGESCMEGHVFHSEVLAWNLSRTDRVWAYVISCGTEIYEKIVQEDDPLKQYWIDALAELAVQFASDYLNEYLKKSVSLTENEQLTFMNPGSADRDIWDLKDQKTLFDLMGDVEGSIGVSLSEGVLMTPSKSLSGLYFKTEEGFVSCWVCSQPHCKTRRAVYKSDFLKREGVS